MPATDLLAERARQVAAGRLADVPSPCVSVCRIDPATELCEGCLRTLDEIAAWGRMEDAEKRQVWACIEQRLAATPVARSERRRA